MRAIVFDGRLKFVEDYPVPVPMSGEALIRVRLAGICGTDLEITRGYGMFRGVLGHEFVGVVEDVKGGDRSIRGRRVAGEINRGCNSCDYCRQGMKNHCENRAVIGIRKSDGAFADYLVLPVENLHEVPGGIPDEEAVFTEPLAAALRVMHQAKPEKGDRVAVIGDGRLGLLVAFVLHRSGSDVTIFGKHEKKLAVAGEKGIKTFLMGQHAKKGEFTLVVEASGSPEGFGAALEMVRPRGTVILKSTTAGSEKFDLTPVVVNEITIIGSRCGPFDEALNALAGRKIDVRPLISGIYGFAEAAMAFDAARERESLKVLIDFRK